MSPERLVGTWEKAGLVSYLPDLGLTSESENLPSVTHLPESWDIHYSPS